MFDELEFNGLDLSDVVTGNSPLEPGKYTVVAEQCELKATKDGSGQYINVKLKVTEGDRQGRTIYIMFNIKNNNAQAVKIGMSQLKSFMEAAGWTQFNLKNVVDLEGATAVAHVKNREEEGYGTRDYVAYFKPVKADTTAGGVGF